jgi:hypothetical protein
MDLNQIYRLVNYISNHHQTGDTFNPEEYNLALKAVNLEMTDEVLKNYEETQKVTDALEFAKVSLEAQQVDSNGRVAKPADYVRISSIIHHFVDYDSENKPVSKTVEVDLVTNSVGSARRSNSITYPTRRDPICELIKGQFQFYPKDIKFVEMHYIRYPKTPVYGGTVDLNTDEFVYDSALSTQLEWPEIDHLRFVHKILSYVGINLQFNQLQQYAEGMKQIDTFK